MAPALASLPHICAVESLIVTSSLHVSSCYVHKADVPVPALAICAPVKSHLASVAKMVLCSGEVPASSALFPFLLQPSDYEHPPGPGGLQAQENQASALPDKGVEEPC